uniref:REH2 DRSM domain-containing protein n=1 Tax=Trypanosoma congolense (strain IL3000) TaxID=1068625 RepID=G0USC0_TRYCI|nr:conserved hypothetical protein [Trypanosoma congolense IL3000]
MMHRMHLFMIKTCQCRCALRYCTIRRNAVKPNCIPSAVNARHCSSSQSSINPNSVGAASAVSEEISPEMVTIEILSVENECHFHVGRSGGASDDEHNSPDSGHSGMAGTDKHRQQQYWDVTSIDNFAKSRVVNYVRRTGNQSTDIFEISQEQMFGKAVYRARCRLQLPAPHHLYVAEGVGNDEKDAVLLAAMHAERVCDALGVPLFRLPMMQKKHAENARRQGRYAPMPGDPVMPENTITPPPLRMVSVPSANGAVVTENDFSTSIAEAEIINDSGPRHQNRVRASKRVLEGGRLTPVTLNKATSSTTGELEDKGQEQEDHGSVDKVSDGQLYHATVHYPWLSSGGQEGGTNVATTGTSPVSFDPTEGGLWQMVNTNSTRCSPSPDALVLPCVYETAAHDRMKDFFLQQGIALKDRITFTHVTVANHSTRMYVAEMHLYDTVVARGKAQTKECAEFLAAMHGELLLDALARPLFPQDPGRQARHAEAVARFGRWAPNPNVGDIHHPRPHDVLPLPLKQQVGGDDVWLDPSVLRRCGYKRSVSERMIAAHIDINNYCGDYIEANPEPELLTEARRALEVWQRDVARNPYPDLFIITRMGDQFRASTLLPVPKAFGIRGGNAVGKTMEQAMDLCALHAVDTLCSLGIPLFNDHQRQQAFVEERRKKGLVTADVMAGRTREEGLVAIPAPSLLAESSSNNKLNPQETSSPYLDGDSVHKKAKKERPPYLPGYIVEGNQPRPLPHICDTLHILQLRIPHDFAVYGEELGDEAIVEAGNEAKVCVQNYLRQQLPKDANVNASVYITGYGKQVSVHNIAYLPLVLPRRKGGNNTKGNTSPRPLSADNTLSGGKKEERTAGVGTQTLNEVSTDRGDLAQCSDKEGPSVDCVKLPKRLLAVGISLKKKDAERVCYLHAVKILLVFGVDVLSTYRAGLPRRKTPQSTPLAAKEEESKGSNSSSSQQQQAGGCTGECDGQLEELQRAQDLEALTLPKPYMHKNMKIFMESGKHFTPPKRRPPPGPYSPF